MTERTSILDSTFASLVAEVNAIVTQFAQLNIAVQALAQKVQLLSTSTVAPNVEHSNVEAQVTKDVQDIDEVMNDDAVVNTNPVQQLSSKSIKHHLCHYDNVKKEYVFRSIIDLAPREEWSNVVRQSLVVNGTFDLHGLSDTLHYYLFFGTLAFFLCKDGKSTDKRVRHGNQTKHLAGEWFELICKLMIRYDVLAICNVNQTNETQLIFAWNWHTIFTKVRDVNWLIPLVLKFGCHRMIQPLVSALVKIDYDSYAEFLSRDVIKTFKQIKAGKLTPQLYLYQLVDEGNIDELQMLRDYCQIDLSNNHSSFLQHAYCIKDNETRTLVVNFLLKHGAQDDDPNVSLFSLIEQQDYRRFGLRVCAQKPENVYPEAYKICAENNWIGQCHWVYSHDNLAVRSKTIRIDHQALRTALSRDNHDFIKKTLSHQGFFEHSMKLFEWMMSPENASLFNIVTFCALWVETIIATRASPELIGKFAYDPFVVYQVLHHYIQTQQFNKEVLKYIELCLKPEVVACIHPSFFEGDKEYLKQLLDYYDHQSDEFPCFVHLLHHIVNQLSC